MIFSKENNYVDLITLEYEPYKNDPSVGDLVVTLLDREQVDKLKYDLDYENGVKTIYAVYLHGYWYDYEVIPKYININSNTHQRTFSDSTTSSSTATTSTTRTAGSTVTSIIAPSTSTTTPTIQKLKCKWNRLFSKSTIKYKTSTPQLSTFLSSSFQLQKSKKKKSGRITSE